MSPENVTENPDNLKYQFILNLENKCYDSNESHSTFDSNVFIEDNQLHCPKTFDGLLCWDSTPAGQLAQQPCSDIILGWDPTRMAYKTCLEDGTWQKNPMTNKYWSNYTNCIDYEDLKFRKIVNDVYVWGYGLSIICLAISLLIFIFYKRKLMRPSDIHYRHLRCSRTLVHIHLFASLTINNVMWIIWYLYVVVDADILQEDGSLCQILHILTQYFMVSTYFWAFCEALHLHVSIYVVFLTNEKLMLWFYFTGWGFPIVITLIYAVLRYHERSTSQCWIGNSDASWSIYGPVLASLGTSFAILGNTVWILATKLRTGTTMSVTQKTIRAACILIPLFGLHYLLIPLRPFPKDPGEHAYQIIAAIINSCQGICVATLFCFTNSEVNSAVYNHFKRWREKKDVITMTGLECRQRYCNNDDPEAGITGDDSYPAIDNINAENGEDFI